MTSKTAELLTKQWLMGVRRGWLSLLKVTPKGWPALFRAVDRLRDFVDNLEEQIKFVRRGQHTANPDSREAQELQKRIKKLREAISDRRSAFTHWFEAEHQDERWLGRGQWSREDGIKMREKYEADFGSYMTTYVKTRTNPAKGQYNREREGSITELLDDVLELLRVEAKALEETIKTEEEYGVNITRDVYSEPSFSDFSIGRMKIIVQDKGITGRDMREYVRHFDKAFALVQRAGFSKLWYGTMFVVSKTYEPLSDEEKARYAEYGYDGLESRAGVYHSGEDIVELTAPGGIDLVRVVIHELGHRYWYKFMRGAQRARFNDLVQTNVSEKYRDHPSGQYNDGVRKPVLPVSEYGASSIEEAFADAFVRFVAKRGLDSDQLESFRSVLAGEIHERVADRFEQALLRQPI